VKPSLLSNLRLCKSTCPSAAEKLNACGHKRNNTRRHFYVKRNDLLSDGFIARLHLRNLLLVAENSGDNMSRGEVLQELRRRKGLTQTQVAEKAGVHLTTVVRAEKDGRSDEETLTAIAGVYGLSFADLLDMVRKARRASVILPGRGTSRDGPYTEAEPEDVDTYQGYKARDIPVIAEGEASPQGELYWDNSRPLIQADEWMSRPPEVKDPRAYAVRVRGDSMVPAYYPGMRLIVSPNIPVQSGHRVYIELLNGERLVKVARRQKNGWILESLNPAYEPRFVGDDEVGTMHKIVYAREL
jgi:phage repressor protein C with HTH and peptisase S24 domain